MSNEYVLRLLGGDADTDETPEQFALRKCLTEILEGKSEIEAIMITGNLINYTRDHVLSALAGIRRAAAITARSSMTSEQIVKATGLSKATVSRLVTENRNY